MKRARLQMKNVCPHVLGGFNDPSFRRYTFKFNFPVHTKNGKYIIMETVNAMRFIHFNKRQNPHCLTDSLTSREGIQLNFKSVTRFISEFRL